MKRAINTLLTFVHNFHLHNVALYVQYIAKKIFHCCHRIKVTVFFSKLDLSGIPNRKIKNPKVFLFTEAKLKLNKINFDYFETLRESWIICIKRIPIQLKTE